MKAWSFDGHDCILDDFHLSLLAQLDIPKSCPQLSQKMPKTKMVNKHLRNKPHAKKLHSIFWALTKTSLNNSWRDHLEIRIEKLGLLVGSIWMNTVHHFTPRIWSLNNCGTAVKHLKNWEAPIKQLQGNGETNISPCFTWNFWNAPLELLCLGTD